MAQPVRSNKISNNNIEAATRTRTILGTASAVQKVMQRRVAPLLGALLIFMFWYSVIWFFDIRPFLLPPPHAILDVLVKQALLLARHGWVTALESLIGLGISIVVGALLGVLIAEIRAFSRAFMPWLVMFQAVPKVAIAPLFVIWFGFGLTSKVVVAFFIAFFPIVVSTVGGLRSVTPEELDLFRTMTRRHWPVFRHLKFPRALPHFFDGVKVGATLALIGAVVGEFVSASRGLGYLTLIANRNLQTDLMFATFVALSVLGIGLFYAVVLAERVMLPWYFAERKRSEGS